MKLLILTAIVIFHFATQCQARVGLYRRQFSPQTTVYEDNQFFDPINPNNDLNLVHHQENVLTGRLILRVSDLTGFLVQKLEQVKKMFDENGWTSLSSWAAYCIDLLHRNPPEDQKYQIDQKDEKDEENQEDQKDPKDKEVQKDEKPQNLNQNNYPAYGRRNQYEKRYGPQPPCRPLDERAECQQPMYTYA